MPNWNSEYTWEEISNAIVHLAWDYYWAHKGSIAIAGADCSPQSLDVGADGTFLRADSTELLGVKWNDLPNCSLPFTKGVTNASGYIAEANTYTSAVYGFVATRPGSIVGLSACLNVTIQTVGGDVTVWARINDNPAFSVTITTAGVAVYKAQATQARGLDTFVAGDLIQLYVDFVSFTGTINPILVLLDLLFDAP